MLLEGPDLQAVDVEVLLGGEGLVVEGGAFVGGASVQLGVQPQAQLAAAKEIKGKRDKVNWGILQNLERQMDRLDFISQIFARPSRQPPTASVLNPS